MRHHASGARWRRAAGASRRSGGSRTPSGSTARRRLEAVGAVGFIALFFAILLGAVALVLRFRRARGDERQQLKWFAGAGGLFALACVLALAPWMGSSDTVGQLLILFAFAGIPVAAGVAILRYRLYDIDVVINRTLVYGALTATLAGAYLGLVLLLQLVLSPYRLRPRHRRLHARGGRAVPPGARAHPGARRPPLLPPKYDAARTLEGFGARLRDEVDLEALDARAARRRAETMQPAHVSLWLRTP